MNAPTLPLLPDVQSLSDPRQLAIDRVGIRAIRHPLTIATPEGPRSAVASVDMMVGLRADQKGTHMSRFVALLQQDATPLSSASIGTLLRSMLQQLEALDGSIEVRFAYFVRKTAPVSGAQSLMDYDTMLSASGSSTQMRVKQKVVVPVTTACPCSKRISDYGAHNQRSHVTITARAKGFVWIEELVDYAEKHASSELYGLLKRPDEKFVTERAYDNPRF